MALVFVVSWILAQVTEVLLSNFNMGIFTLVLSGASSKFFLTGGAVQYLYDNSLLDIKNYVGTSAGAIICFFLIIYKNLRP